MKKGCLVKNVRSEMGNLHVEMGNPQRKKDKNHKQLMTCERNQASVLEDIEIETKCYAFRTKLTNRSNFTGT